MHFLAHVGLLVLGVGAFALWPNIRSRRTWAGATKIHGIPCSTTERRASRGNSVTVIVAIPCDARFEFTLRRKRTFDRVAEILHLIREFETADERFDEAIYIGSDERGIGDWLARDAQARATFLDLIALRPDENTRVTSIVADGSALTLSALAQPPMFTSAPDGLGDTVAEACLSGLQSCVERLQAFAASDADPAAFKDPYAVPVRTFTSMAAGLLFIPFAVFFLMRLEAPRIELMSGMAPDKYNLAAIAGVLALLLILAVPLLMGSARLHTVVGALLVSGLLGTVFVAPAFIRELNEEWDRSKPEQYTTKVITRYVTHGRRSTFYHVWLSDWRSEQEHRDLQVDRGIYNELKEGDDVTVSERQGFLGRPWVSEISRGWETLGAER